MVLFFKKELLVFLVFLRLGLTSFGGPVAHLAYFRAEIVQRRRWIDEAAYADLLALCQFLPGPASSQAGFALGVMRGGYVGGLAAWIGFTLPSAILMVMFAYGAGRLVAWPAGLGVLHGCKLVAVAIVAQALVGMVPRLCPDRVRACIAVGALVLMLVAPGSLFQVATIALGGVAGSLLCRGKTATMPDRMGAPVSRKVGVACLSAFFVLLALAVVPVRGGALALFDAFYRAGALVFGGGHVVLPLLRDAVVAPGWVSDSTFLAGYGAAQALPGPLFTFAAYLGAVSDVRPGGVLGSAIALVGIFLPGTLCLLGTLPFWHELRCRTDVQAAMRGANAAVVGLLGAAFFNPVWTGAVRSSADFAIAVAGFVLLVVGRAPPLLVLVLSALAAMGRNE